MNTRKLILIVIALLALTFIVSVDDSSSATDYNVYVKDVMVTSDNCSDILEDGGHATYDPSTSTLTLYDLVIDMKSGDCVRSVGNLNVVISGKVLLSTSQSGRGLASNSDISVSGSGSLIIDTFSHCVDASHVTLNVHMIANSGKNAVNSSGQGESFIVNGGHIMARGGASDEYSAFNKAPVLTDYADCVVYASRTRTYFDPDESYYPEYISQYKTVLIDTGAVYLGGVKVTLDNKDDILGDGTATYNFGTRTLTLSGVSITTSYAYGAFNYGLYVPWDIDVEVSGNNTFSDGCGIFSLGIISMSGTGTLKTGDISVMTNLETYETQLKVNGTIQSANSITFEESVVVLNSATTAIDVSRSLTITNGDVTIESSQNGVNVVEELTVTGGFLKIFSSNKAIFANSVVLNSDVEIYADKLCIDSESLVINGESLLAVSPVKALTTAPVLTGYTDSFIKGSRTYPLYEPETFNPTSVADYKIVVIDENAVYVDGVKVTEANKDNILDDPNEPTATYNFDNHTLTLTSAALNTGLPHGEYTYAIYAADNIVINLVNENTTGSSFLVFTYGTIAFSGTGSLSTGRIAGLAGLTVGQQTLTLNGGLRAFNILNLNGTTLTVQSGSEALYAYSNITIVDSVIDVSNVTIGIYSKGSVSAEGSDITLRCTDGGIVCTSLSVSETVLKIYAEGEGAGGIAATGNVDLADTPLTLSVTSLGEAGGIIASGISISGESRSTVVINGVTEIAGFYADTVAFGEFTEIVLTVSGIDVIGIYANSTELSCISLNMTLSGTNVIGIETQGEEPSVVFGESSAITLTLKATATAVAIDSKCDLEFKGTIAITITDESETDSELNAYGVKTTSAVSGPISITVNKAAGAFGIDAGGSIQLSDAGVSVTMNNVKVVVGIKTTSTLLMSGDSSLSVTVDNNADQVLGVTTTGAMNIAGTSSVTIVTPGKNTSYGMISENNVIINTTGAVSITASCSDTYQAFGLSAANLTIEASRVTVNTSSKGVDSEGSNISAAVVIGGDLNVKTYSELNVNAVNNTGVIYGIIVANDTVFTNSAVSTTVTADRDSFALGTKTLSVLGESTLNAECTIKSGSGNAFAIFASDLIELGGVSETIAVISAPGGTAVGIYGKKLKLTYGKLSAKGTTYAISTTEGIEQTGYTITGSDQTLSDYNIAQKESSKPVEVKPTPVDVDVTITVNVSGYGTVSETEITVEKGSVISVSGNKITIDGNEITATPTEATAEYTYEFTGWDIVDGRKVTGDMTITAIFERTCNPYDVTINLNGGSYEETPEGWEPVKDLNDVIIGYKKQFRYGDTVELPDGPSKVGHTFSSWDPTPGTMPAEDTVFDAVYTVNKYEAKVLLDGGYYEETPEGWTALKEGDIIIGYTKQFDYNSEFSMPGTPLKVGYTFSNWDSEVPEVMPAEDLEFTAQYIINNHSVTIQVNMSGVVVGYKIDNGDPVQYSGPFSIYYNDTVSLLINMLDGYSLSVTSSQVTISSEYRFAMPDTDVIVDVVFTPNKYNVTLNLDGGYYTTPPSGWTPIYADETIVGYTIQWDYGTKIVIPDGVLKTGYTFANWDPAVPSTVPSHDCLFTAKYTINQYTLTLDLNGGKTEQSMEGWTKTENGYEKEFDYDQVLEIPNDITKRGYTFTGWDPVSPGKMPANDLTLVAQYDVNSYMVVLSTDSVSITCTFTYRIDDGELTGYTVPFGVNYGQSVKIYPTAITGYTITLRSDNVEIVDDSFYMPDTDVTVLAKPELNSYYMTLVAPSGYPCTFKYTLDGGDAKDYTVPVYVKYGQNVKVIPSHITGYNALLTSEQVTLDNGEFTMPDEEVTITASYTIMTLSVTFSVTGHDNVVILYSINGGGEMEYTGPFNVQYGTTIDILEISEYDGYSVTVSSQQVTIVEGSFKVLEENVVVNVVYELLEYRITLYMNDGSYSVAPIGWEAVETEGVITAYYRDFKFDSLVTLLEGPSKTGYTFVNWYPDPTPYERMPAEDLKFTAAFLLNTHTVTISVTGLTDVQVKYVINGNETVYDEPFITNYGTSVKVIPETRVGYSYAMTSDQVVITDGTFILPDIDVTVLITYTLNSYPVTLISSGATCTFKYTVDSGPETDYQQPFTVYYGQTVTVIPSVVKGYTMTLVSDEVVLDDGSFVMPDKTVTVTAQFTINSYSITLNLTGTTGDLKYKIGSGPETSYSGPFDAEYQQIITVIAFDKVGFHMQMVSEEATIINDHFAVPDSDVNVTITYEPNNYILRLLTGSGAFQTAPVGWTAVTDGKGTIAGYEKSFAYLSDTALPADDPYYKGHDFTGWSPAVPGTMPADNLVVTATYILSTYNVTLNSSESLKYKIGSGPEIDYAGTFTASYGQMVTVIAPDKEGLMPKLVTSDVNVNGMRFIIPDNDVTVSVGYVICEKDVRITVSGYPGKIMYSINGAQAVEYKGLFRVVYDSTVTIIAPQVAGYSVPVITSADVTITDGSFKMPSKDVSIEISSIGNEYVLTMDLNGGHFEVEPKDWERVTDAQGKVVAYKRTYRCGSAVDLSPYVPMKTGYTFNSWDGACTTMPANDLTVKAIFDPIIYTLTWVADGTTTLIKAPYASVIVPPADPTKASTETFNYVFKRWVGYTQGMTVSGDAAFYAEFSSMIRIYDIAPDKTVTVDATTAEAGIPLFLLEQMKDDVNKGKIDSVTMNVNVGSVTIGGSEVKGLEGSPMFAIYYASESEIPESLREAVRNRPIFNTEFDTSSMTITVSFNYTLKDGEDPNGLSIWYLMNDGSYEKIGAKYSNGEISFQTNHNSYYSVMYEAPAKSTDMTIPIIIGAAVAGALVIIGICVFIYKKKHGKKSESEQ